MVVWGVLRFMRSLWGTIHEWWAHEKKFLLEEGVLFLRGLGGCTRCFLIPMVLGVVKALEQNKVMKKVSPEQARVWDTAPNTQCDLSLGSSCLESIRTKL